MFSEWRLAFYLQPISMVYNEMMTCYILWLGAMPFLRGRVRRATAWLIVAASLAMIAVCTLLGRTQGGGELMLTPLITYQLAKEEPEFYRTMLMNVCLFLPLGLALPYVLPARVKHRFWVSVLIGAALSVSIELCQLVLQIGRCETDDVLMNTLGTAMGASVCLAHSLLRRWFNYVQNKTGSAS